MSLYKVNVELKSCIRVEESYSVIINTSRSRFSTFFSTASSYVIYDVLHSYVITR
jgi:hypothetical protein